MGKFIQSCWVPPRVLGICEVVSCAAIWFMAYAFRFYFLEFFFSGESQIEAIKSLQKLTKNYTKYWEKNETLKSERQAEMFTLEFTNPHIWQYLQILYSAAIWNSGDSSLSTDLHFQNRINLKWTGYISSNEKWIYR